MLALVAYHDLNLNKGYRDCKSSREQNSVPKSRRASSHSVMVIKMSRLTINHFFNLGSLHGSVHCCETDRETHWRTFCP